MSLQRKFVALLTVLALAVILNIVAALWSLTFVQRELVRPLTDLQQILPVLGQIKRGITIEASLIGGGAEGFPFRPAASPPDPSAVRSRFDAVAREVAAHLTQLEVGDQYQSLVGISTTRNLNARIQQSRASAEDWFSAPDDAKRTLAIEQFVEAHDLIERMEAKVTDSAASASVKDYLPTVRMWLTIFMLASLVIVALASLLGVILVRRWVTRPVGILRDAADRLARGEFTHRVPVTAQDDLGMLSAEINHMAGMISAMQDERVERERLAAAGEVVRRLAHNLRNPLSGIRSLAELSRADLPPQSPVRENQDRIVQSVDRFERWLAEVLSATSPLALQPQRIHIGPWINAVVDPLRPAAAAKGVSIQVVAEAPDLAVFDPRHLEQALVGIINNAIQASPSGQQVTIESSCDAERWQLAISDHGPGVSPELTEKIFHPYFTTKRDGTGIGLAVAKQVVEQHSGRIRVEPALNASQATHGGVGARFVLQIPLAGPPQLANTGQAADVDGARFGQDSDRRR